MRTYWATKPATELGGEIDSRAGKYRDGNETNGRRDLWRRSARLVFGLDANGSYRRSHAVMLSGPDLENVELRANIYRSILRQQVVMTAGSRPSFKCRSRAYDAQTDEVRLIGDALLDQVLNESLEQKCVTACWHAISYGEGWISATWDPLAGPRNDAGQPLGDVRFRVHRPDEVVRDTSVMDQEHDWVILCVQHSRWTLAAQYPEHAEHILGASSPSTLGLWTDWRSPVRDTSAADSIVAYEFYHRSTPALPQGRSSLIVGGRVIADSTNIYDQLPVYPMIVTREPGSAHGYADAWDLMGMQQMVDSIVTQVATAQENFGQRTIFVGDGAGFDAEEVGGLRLISGTQPPIPIDLGVGSVQNGEAAIALLSGLMQKMSGLNDAATGQSGASESGAKVAMLQQIATQINSGNQLAYVSMFAGVMRGTLDCYKRFASEERVIHITGRLRAPMVKRWSAESLSALDGVDIEMGSAAMRTTSYRQQLIDGWVQAGLITDPQVALSAIETGRLETVTDSARAMQVQIERENEALQNGQPVRALGLDHHATHITDHATILQDQTIRENDQIVQLVMTHIQEHVDQWNQMSTTPQGLAILAATHQQPSPAAAMMAGPMGPGPGGPPMPPGAGPNPGGPQPPPQAPPMPDAQNRQPPPQGAQPPPPGVNQPNLPAGAQPGPQ